MTEKTDKNYGPIWVEIKNRTMNVFGLPNQTVENYFQPMMGDDKKLILSRSDNRPMGAALPALEEVLLSFTPVVNKKNIRGPQPFGSPEQKPEPKYRLEQSPGYVTILLN